MRVANLVTLRTGPEIALVHVVKAAGLDEYVTFVPGPGERGQYPALPDWLVLLARAVSAAHILLGGWGGVDNSLLRRAAIDEELQEAVVAGARMGLSPFSLYLWLSEKTQF